MFTCRYEVRSGRQLGSQYYSSDYYVVTSIFGILWSPMVDPDGRSIRFSYRKDAELYIARKKAESKK